MLKTHHMTRMKAETTGLRGVVVTATKTTKTP